MYEYDLFFPVYCIMEDGVINTENKVGREKRNREAKIILERSQCACEQKSQAIGTPISANKMLVRV